MAFDLYLKITGPDIRGDSTAKGFEGQIEVYNFSFGVQNHASFLSGGGAGAGKATPSDLTILLRYSKASPELFKRLVQGDNITTAELTLVKSGSGPDSGKPFLVHTLSNVFVTDYETTGTSGADDVTDSISFAFGKIETKYSAQKDTGEFVVVEDVTWDFVANKGS